MTRESIWDNNFATLFDESNIFQPEELGYVVSKLQLPDITYDIWSLSHNGNFYFSLNRMLIIIDLFIILQSNSDIFMKTRKKAIALVVLSSKHPTSTYCWQFLEMKDVSSPVIYVNKSGAFRCIINDGKSEVKSHIFNVKLELNCGMNISCLLSSFALAMIDLTKVDEIDEQGSELSQLETSVHVDHHEEQTPFATTVTELKGSSILSRRCTSMQL